MKPNTLGIKSNVTPPATPHKDGNDQQTLTEQTKLHNDRLRTNTRLRTHLAYWVIVIDTLWIIAVLLILCFNASHIHLSDTVLLMMLGTTTINILGLAFIVLKGLFGATRKQYKQ
ncbi:MAG: hypothetical protein PUG96_02610 [Prevotellaceae bacterium]|nr:hypothetical protein [Prevotella sp.]MDD7272845.1 hypothetical protein [Prevotellaceae bacterium]